MVKWAIHSAVPIKGEPVMVAVMRPWQALWAIIHQYQGSVTLLPGGFLNCNPIILKNKVSYEMPHEQHETCRQDCVVDVHLIRLASCSV